ncbi:MAG TPA: AraC family transcriptional regulator [Bacteroidia bacterium]|nr:AraC family transcriptional regulator [Bacteroidia bacterium]
MNTMVQPGFNSWTSIFLLAAVQGVFVSLVLLIGKKQNRFANSMLALLVLLFSITLFEYVLYWTNYLTHFPHFMSLSEGFPFLFGVILFFYFRTVFEKRKIEKQDFIHLLPFLLFLVYMLPRYLSFSEVKLLWIQGKKASPSLFHYPRWLSNLPGLHWVKTFAMSGYLLVTYYRYRAFSKLNPEVQVWFNWISGLFAGFILSYASYFVLINFSFFNSAWDYMISFSMLFMIYFIAWFGYLQPKVFQGFSLKEAIVEPEKYKNSPLNDSLGNELLVILETSMSSKKIFLDPEIRLEKLATLLGIKKHLLSQLINEKKGMSFFEYINSLRVEEAKLLLKQKSKKELTVSEVAYMVGFNNKVSFNSTFKKITGKTPTEYRNQLENSNATIA